MHWRYVSGPTSPFVADAVCPECGTLEDRTGVECGNCGAHLEHPPSDAREGLAEPGNGRTASDFTPVLAEER